MAFYQLLITCLLVWVIKHLLKSAVFSVIQLANYMLSVQHPADGDIYQFIWYYKTHIWLCKNAEISNHFMTKTIMNLHWLLIQCITFYLMLLSRSLMLKGTHRNFIYWKILAETARDVWLALLRWHVWTNQHLFQAHNMNKLQLLNVSAVWH